MAKIVWPELNPCEIPAKGIVVAPCYVIAINETGDPVKIRLRALDPEGDLLGFSLRLSSVDQQRQRSISLPQEWAPVLASARSARPSSCGGLRSPNWA